MARKLNSKYTGKLKKGVALKAKPTKVKKKKRKVRTAPIDRKYYA